ncbi:MAG: MCE family protein [Rhodococcus sp. (in: high G+C Gram-positive bacteria)]|nr:MAG: MCE family protein [Rhodococcus sp. (in: high G+C Gram-positive bacteria)]
MFTRLIKMQLTAFAIIAVVATAVVLVQYLKLPRLMGFQQYHVSAEITDATGIYVGALVTLRGVEVGKVAGLALHGTGARLDLSLDDATSIPADVHATIRSSTAVGEQYVELNSGTDQPPFLQAGTVIPADRTTPQEPITNMLTSVTELARAIPADSSAVLLDEMSTAFQGAEQDIRELISHGDTIVTEAVDHADSSGEVFRELPPFLKTQSSVNADVQSLTRDMASFTAQVAQSDHDLRAVVDDAPTTATAITDLEAGISQSLPVLLDNLTSTGEVLRLQIPGLTQSLVLYPAVVAALQTAFIHTDEGTSIRLRVRTTANDPPPCYEGFNPMSEQRAWEDVSPAPQPADMYCKVAQDDPRDVRGARNTPCANDQELRTPYFEECLGRPRGSQPVPVGSVPPVTLSSPGFPALPPSSPAPAAAPAPVPDGTPASSGLQAQTSDWKTTYDPRTGLLSGPDGRLYLLGTVSAKEEGMEKETWKNLILK